MRLIGRLEGGGLGAVLARGTAGIFAVKTAGLGLALAAEIVLTRLLGAESYGVYVQVIAWLAVLVVAAKMGQDAALVRYVSAYYAGREWGYLRGVIRHANRLVTALSLSLSLILALAVHALGNILDHELKNAFLAGCFLLPLMSLLTLREASIQALKRFILAQVSSRILNHILVALTAITAFTMLSGRFDGAVAVWCVVFAHSISVSTSSFWLRRSLPAQARTSRPAYLSRQWLATGVGLLIVSGQYLIMNRIDILMLGPMAGKAVTGIYGAAVRLSWLVSFFLQTVSVIAAPLISELYTSGRKEELQRLVRLVLHASALCSATVFGVLVLGGKFALGIFGPEFTAGYAALTILAVAQLINSLTGPSGFLLSMTGHERHYGVILFLSLLLNAFLNYILIPRYGMIGAAAATAVANILMNGLSVVLIYRLLGIYSVFGLSRGKK